MEDARELNKELKEEVNKVFADLSKEIGTNRQQLANKIMNVQIDINKELSRNKVDEQRKKEILIEVSKTVKMAAQQLPHLHRNPMATPMLPAKPPARPVVKAAAKQVEKPAAKKVEKPAAKQAAKSHPKPAPKVAKKKKE